MLKQTNNAPTNDDPFLDLFNLPKDMVRPAVSACRLFNTLVDAIFYDVPDLRATLHRLDAQLADSDAKLPSRIIDFDAISDPEGSLLLIDARTAPYVHRYTNVQAYLDSPYQETRAVRLATITGVGSSALGSAAMAWAISTALRRPVLAIVPGYGVADMVLQGLGGWFGFGLFDYLHTKMATQSALAGLAPDIASLGRGLSASAPGAETLRGAPVYRRGSGSSDVLHALMLERPGQFEILVGHSKGALQIGNALHSLPEGRTQGLHIVTLGCPIAKDAPGAQYFQYLGLFDALGQLNMWGNLPSQWVPSWHTTNPYLPPAMMTGALVRQAA
ncbi:hypothetical protein MTR62_12605 [Novosphingobium sp. 1949]|uniref:Fungal lipase-like domain-containing protein n=1 Tax=Novosphingobium organovorum TaxID=2930092 RepID=A0ABT0BF46_9SPHN|nr:hypothetical protein [Novosphingobium organovorum]MCJ2183525.1 hypothetical protein [Novosphingobium organovorum]